MKHSQQYDSQIISISLQRTLDYLTSAGVCDDFYLAGGTGLALLLGHRRSVDLDFFSQSNPLDFDGRRSMLERVQSAPTWRLVEEKDGTIHGRVGRVSVSFLKYTEPLVKPLLHRGQLRIASLEDIGLMKLGAIIGRGARKDFVDVYTICQQLPLQQLLALSHAKFRDARDFTLQALRALSDFEDAERDPAVVTPTPLDWEHVKTFITKEVHTLSQAYLA